MTDFAELSATAGDAAVIAELADEARARDLIELVDGRVAGVVLAKGQTLHQIDLDQYQAQPFRKTGRVALSDADSFVAYVDRHSLAKATTLWAGLDAGTVVAVLDDHAAHADADTEGAPGWGGHRATLTLTQTADWKHWLAGDGRFMSQTAFAEHIEDGVEAIRDPDAATMLEVAQTFHAKSGVDFKSTKRLGGEIEFAYQETVTAKAGQAGKLEVPQILTLGLAPFEGNELFEVKARVRFRLADGNLSIGYRLIRPDKVRRAAFDDVVSAVAGRTGLPVMSGMPRNA